MSHLSLGLLAAITLVGSRARDGHARARALCELGLFLCSVAFTPLLGPKLLEQRP